MAKYEITEFDATEILIFELDKPDSWVASNDGMGRVLWTLETGDVFVITVEAWDGD